MGSEESNSAPNSQLPDIMRRDTSITKAPELRLPEARGPVVSEEERAQARATIAKARAESTRERYRAAWQRFVAWCESRDATPLPALPETVIHFLRQVRTQRRHTKAAPTLPKIATLNVYKAAIQRAHEVAGQTSPLLHPMVREAWRGLCNERKMSQHEAAALTHEKLERLLPRIPATTRGIQDRAVLLVGHAGALRVSELCNLRLGALEIRNETLRDGTRRPAVTFELATRKTDQAGAEPHLVVLPQTGDPVLCPVLALHTWIDTMIGAKAPVGELTPLFRGVTRHGTIRHPDVNKPRGGGLHPNTVGIIVRRSVKLIGEPEAAYSAHSLRVGFVTSADELGISRAKIAEVTGHKTSRMIDHYTRHRTGVVNNPGFLMYRGDRSTAP